MSNKKDQQGFMDSGFRRNDKRNSELRQNDEQNSDISRDDEQDKSDQSVGYYDPTKQSSAAVQLTDKAIAHVKQKIVERGSGIGLRLSIKRMGCSGYGYVVDFVDEKGENDSVFPINDALSVYVDAQSLPKVQGTIIDFERQGINEVFTYKNPNQTGECGCGESFSIEDD